MEQRRFEIGMRVRCINHNCCEGMANDEVSVVVGTDEAFNHIKVADNIPGRKPWYQCKDCLAPVDEVQPVVECPPNTVVMFTKDRMGNVLDMVKVTGLEG